MLMIIEFMDEEYICVYFYVQNYLNVVKEDVVILEWCVRVSLLGYDIEIVMVDYCELIGFFQVKEDL